VKHMNKPDKQALTLTFIAAFIAAILIGIVVFGPSCDAKLHMALVQSAYPGCPVVQTHAGVYIVRKPDNSVIQVHTAGLFHLYISETKELIPQNTLF